MFCVPLGALGSSDGSCGGIGACVSVEEGRVSCMEGRAEGTVAVCGGPFTTLAPIPINMTRVNPPTAAKRAYRMGIKSPPSSLEERWIDVCVESEGIFFFTR